VVKQQVVDASRLDENFHIDNQTIRKTNDNFGNSLLFQPATELHFDPFDKELLGLLESRLILHERQPRGGSSLQCQRLKDPLAFPLLSVE
jgi:hypothetical protein